MTVPLQASSDIITKFLEFCYTDRVMAPITGLEVQNLHLVCQTLGLEGSAKVFETMWQCIKQKLEDELVKDLQANSQGDNDLLTSHQI